MKKTPRKLNLSRETLRALEEPALVRAIGQAAPAGTLVPSCDGYCDITMGCDITRYPCP
jgi:hypothetical protein